MPKDKLLGMMLAATVSFMALLSAAPGIVCAQQLQKVPRPLPLAGTRWVMEESQGQRLAQDGWRPYFKLRTVERYEDGSAGRVEDAADWCDSDLTGAYRATGDRLRVRFTFPSLVACKVPKGRMQEDLRRALTDNLQFQIHGSELELLEADGTVRSRFIAADRR